MRDRRTEVRLSMKEHQKLEVLREVLEGRRTQRAAARALGLSERWIRELAHRVHREGGKGVIHGNQGQPSNRRIADRTRQKIVKIYGEKYEDFNLTHFREMLQERENMKTPPCRETLRHMLLSAGVWRRRYDAPRHRLRRARREYEGELLQMDASIHAWLGPEHPDLALVGAIDDATGDVPCARFFEAETTEAYLWLLKSILESRGVPTAVYTDRDSVFVVNNARQVELGRAAGRAPQTQFGRALKELGIEWIPAYSPQAKGRIERLWGTFQDRLLKELRLEKIQTSAQADEYLKCRFLPKYRRQFRQPAARPGSIYRTAPSRVQIEAILCWKQSRVLARDHTFSLEANVWQVLASNKIPALTGRRVEVRRTLRGEIQAWYGPDRLSIRPAPKISPLRAACPDFHYRSRGRVRL